MRGWRDHDRSQRPSTWVAALLLAVAGLLMFAAIADAERAASATVPARP